MLNGLKDDFIEDLLINLRLLKPPPAVLTEDGVMRHRIGQGKSNKPTVGDIKSDLFNEASFRANSVQVTYEQHLEQHDRVNTGASIIFAVQGRHFSAMNEKSMVSLIFRNRCSGGTSSSMLTVSG
jgi:hypothetical protein